MPTTKRLGEVLTLLKDGTHGTHARTSDGVPFLSAKNITDAGTVYCGSEDDRISDSEYRRIHSSFELKRGDVLLTVVGSLGRRAVHDGQRVTFQRSVAFLRAASGLLPAYLFHALGADAFQRALGQRSNATAQAGVYLGELAKIELPVPSLGEQQRIAEILDTVDDAIRKTEEVIAKLKQVKQGLLHDLLTRGVDGNGDLRDPHRHPEQFQECRLGRIPRAWRTGSIEELTAAPVCYGIVQAGPNVADGVCVLMIRDLGGDFRTNLHRTAASIERQYARSRTATGDVVLSIKGTIGRVAIVPEWYVGNISRDLARLRFDRAVIPAFAKLYFGSPSGNRALELCVVGTTRAEVSIAVLKRLMIPVPPVAEQTEICARLDALELRVAVLNRELCKLQLLKQGLMDDLLTGRVRVAASHTSAP